MTVMTSRSNLTTPAGSSDDWLGEGIGDDKADTTGWALGQDVRAEEFRRTLLRAAMQRLRRLAALPTGWDGGHGRPAHPGAVQAAMALLEELQPLNGPTPQVGPLSDGSVEVSWLVDGDEVHLELTPDLDVYLWIRQSDGALALDEEFVAKVPVIGALDKVREHLAVMGRRVKIRTIP